jgi:phage-related protein
MAAFAGLTPSTSSQMAMKYRVAEFQYGNGYKAVGPDGANGKLISWQLSFENLAAPQAAALEDWLDDNPPWVTWAGDGVFLPSNRYFRMTTEGYQKTHLPGNVATFTFSVDQAF